MRRLYRLNIVSLPIPSLRERKDDIPLLIEHFLTKYCRQYNKPIKEVSPDAMEVFISYPWPGNIRELENKCQQLVVMSPFSVISAEDLQLPLSELSAKEIERENFKVVKKRVADTFEKTYLTYLLTENRGDVVSSARSAGTSRTAFWNLLKKHNLSPKQFHY